jgi:hypothetical protein
MRAQLPLNLLCLYATLILLWLHAVTGLERGEDGMPIYEVSDIVSYISASGTRRLVDLRASHNYIQGAPYLIRCFITVID